MNTQSKANESASLSPANSSSFSEPVILFANISSPVPRAPYFPLRRMRARSVVGLSPFWFRTVWFFDDTCLDPTGTRSRDCEVAADRFMALIFAIATLVRMKDWFQGRVFEHVVGRFLFWSSHDQRKLASWWQIILGWRLPQAVSRRTTIQCGCFGDLGYLSEEHCFVAHFFRW